MGLIQNLQVSSNVNRDATSKRTSVLFTLVFQVVEEEIPTHSVTLRKVPLPLLQQVLADLGKLRIEVHPLSEPQETPGRGGEVPASPAIPQGEDRV